MANEYLQRTPTSTGNRKVWTWSGWVKLNKIANQALFSAGTSSPAQRGHIRFNASNGSLTIIEDSGGYELVTTQLFRDFGSWQHILCAFDSTQGTSSDRIKLYVNGIKINSFTTSSYPSINFDSIFNQTIVTANGNLSYAGNIYPLNGELADVFFVDGQALTPDVFGFYKEGKGYISAGSTQATDFRPGQWVPKTPRVIKTEINRRGGFGVNGFYLPMNDSKNFGADFHGEPNSIITLNEKLPQPRVGVATTAAVGLGYTDVLRADPYAANLVLALPFVSSGLCTNGTNVGVNTGFGDYSVVIKGSGSAKVGVSTASISIATTAGYYGSSAFFNGNGNYLDFGNSSDFSLGGGQNFTVEFWTFPTSYAQGGGGTEERTIVGKWSFEGSAVGWRVGITTSNIVLVSPSSSIHTTPITLNQWSHIAVVGQGTKTTFYMNGVAVGISTANTWTDTTTKSLLVGALMHPGYNYFYNGYLQDLRVYKGVAKYTGGFDVPKPYTPVGIATWRAVPDTTANNFATLNAVDNNGGSITNGNLTYTDDGSSSWNNSRATIGISTGKWYWEMRADAVVSSVLCASIAGAAGSDTTSPKGAQLGFLPGQTNTAGVTYYANGSLYSQANPFIASWGATYTNGDIVNIAVDMNSNNGCVYFGKNGTWQNSGNPVNATGFATNNLLSVCPTWFPISGTYFSGSAQSFNFGQNPTFSGNVAAAGTFTDSNGKGLFKYQPPSGFLALCEDNLPTPAISDPGDYFKTVLWTGDGNSGRSIVGVGFTPDLVWIKSRTVARNHRLQDSVRGFVNYLSSDITNAEYVNLGDVSSANSDGFSLLARDNQNASGETYTAWCWRAGAGTTSTNTDGSIQSVVSVNQTAGFSIVSYTGNGTDPSTIGHGLGKAPGLIIAKGRDNAVNWPVYHKSTTASNFLYLNSTSAALGSSAMWNTNPTSSVFSVGNQSQNNSSGVRYIAYCWAEIEGFSKFGSYVGNGNADGSFVYCGFKPAWILFKRTDSSFSGDWVIYDSSRNSYNPCQNYLLANTSDIEGVFTNVDYLSNGFKLRSTSSINTSGATFIFAAFAESPINYSNSK